MTFDPGRLARVVNRRTATVIVVVGVAAVAAIQSYSHIYWLATTHGQSRLDSALAPLGVDGLILAMTLVLLDQASRELAAPLLATFMLWFGVAATIAANVIYGLRFGVTGACVSAWPAGAFIGCAHVMANVVRPVPDRYDEQVSEGTDPLKAARDALAASVAAGNPMSIRQLARQFGITRPRAKQVKAEITDEAEEAAAA